MRTEIELKAVWQIMSDFIYNVKICGNFVKMICRGQEIKA